MFKLMRYLWSVLKGMFLFVQISLVLCGYIIIGLVGVFTFGVCVFRYSKEYVIWIKVDDRTPVLLASEARAFASMGILFCIVARYIWGKQSSPVISENYWWAFFLASLVGLGIVVWKRVCKKVKRDWWFLKVLSGFIFIWVVFVLTTRSLPYQLFLAMALCLLVISLIWIVFLNMKLIPQDFEKFVKSKVLGYFSSLMGVLCILAGSITTYQSFIDNNIHSNYVVAAVIIGLIISMLLYIGLLKNLWIDK